MTTLSVEQCGAGPRLSQPLIEADLYLRRPPVPCTQALEDGPPPRWRQVLHRLLQVGLLAGCVLLAWALHSICHDRGLFTLGSVVLEGVSHLDRGEVLAVIHESFPRNLMAIDPGALRARLERFSWVSGVVVRKAYPDRLHIRVEERVPVGVARTDRLWLFDAGGVFIEEYRPAEHRLDGPILAGLRTATDPMVQEENRDRVRHYLRFLEEIGTADGSLPGRLSEVDVAELGNLVVVPLEGTPRVQLGSESFRERLELFFQVIEQARRDNGPVAEVDMRQKDKVIVRAVVTS